MTVTSFLGIFVLSAVVFALTYASLVRRLTRSVLTPYPKADVRRRLFAAAIDGLLVAVTFLMYRNSGFVVWLAGGAVYLLFRDAVRGQSLGKFFMGPARSAGTRSFFFPEPTSSPSSSKGRPS